MSKKKMSKKKKLHILLWIVAVLVIAGAAGYTLFIKTMMEQEEAVYRENTAQYGILQNGVTESGTVEFGVTSQVYDLDLSTEDDDDDDDDDDEEEDYLKVEEVYVAVGQRISEGDPVYKFTQSSIDKVRKTLTYAKTEAQIALNEAQTQYDVGVLTAGLSYDETMLASSLAEQSYNNTIAQLSNDLAAKTLEIEQLLSDFEEFIGDGTIYAQGSGLITEVGFSEDEYLETAGVLISYATSDAMTVSVDVSEEDVVTMKVGDSVTLAFTAYEDETYEGIIQSITTTATSRGTATVSYPVVISIQGDTSKLYEGMTADVTFITEATDAEVIYVPRKAIVEENGKYYIYKKEQDEYVLSPIETGFTDGENMEIISGLDKDETYYIAGVALKEDSNGEE